MGYKQRSIRSLLVALTAVLLVAGVVRSSDAAVQLEKKITPSGVGGVNLGEKFSKIRAEGRVGPLRPGCELGENTRSAKLKPPLEGSANFTTDSGPRRVTDIQVTGGGKARGVEVGSSKSEVKQAYPRARFNHSTEDVFGITLVRIKRNAGGRIHMAIDVDTKLVTLIGIPRLAFCE